MAYFEILLPLGLILLLSKLLSMVCQRFGLPKVIGMLIAGLLLGLIRYIPSQTIFTVGEGGTLEGLSFIAKIGVILIMFSAGLETDLTQFKKTGWSCVVITALGVIIPCGLGFLVATLFNGGFSMLSQNLYDNIFYGVILSATSVSVTVATLKELGKLNGKLGASIISAAILDDIIGVILLSLVIGLKNSSVSGVSSGAGEVLWMIGKMLIFFALAVAVGVLIHKIFKWMDEKWPHKLRVSVFGLAICFLYSYCAEKIFGVADITGAFIAGMVLSGLKNTSDLDYRVETSNYMIFSPVFFANICLTTTFNGLNMAFVGFGLAYVFIGLLGKVLGGGLGGLICKYGIKDSLRVGIGMMARAEVVLVCTQKGIDNGMVDPAIMPFVLILIIVSSLLTPLLLKLSYKKQYVTLEHLPVETNQSN